MIGGHCNKLSCYRVIVDVHTFLSQARTLDDNWEGCMDDNSYSTYCPSLGMDDNRTVTATGLAWEGGLDDNRIITATG